MLLYAGERAFPGRPIALGVVVLAIVAASVIGLPALGIPVTGEIPPGLPSLALPTLRLRDVDGIFPLAAGCLLLAYIEGVSAARSFATKHGYELDPRQEFLGLGAANLAAALGHGYPVAGGLSQSAVNEKGGARTPLALVFASLTLAVSSAFSHRFLAKSAQSCSRCHRIHGCARFGRCPHIVADVADQQTRFLRGDDRACRGAFVGNSARHIAGCRSFSVDSARPSISAARSCPRSHTGDHELFRSGASSGKRTTAPCRLFSVRRRRCFMSMLISC